MKSGGGTRTDDGRVMPVDDVLMLPTKVIYMSVMKRSDFSSLVPVSVGGTGLLDYRNLDGSFGHENGYFPFLFLLLCPPRELFCGLSCLWVSSWMMMGGRIGRTLGSLSQVLMSIYDYGGG